MKVKLIKSWKGHKEKTVLEVDEKTYAEMKTDGVCVDFKDDDDASTKAFEATRKSMIEEATTASVKAVQEALKQMAGGESKMIHISVKDRSDDDPTFGYLEGNQKGLDEIVKDKDAVNFAFGQFARDVWKAANNGGLTEKLMKCKQRSERIIQKAAGDGMVATGAGEDGGFLIFSAASRLIQTETLENAIVRPRSGRITMGTQLLQIPYLRDLDHSTGLVYGGVKIYFDDELAQSTASKIKLEKMEFKLKKMTALGFASEEWIKWSPVSLGSWLIPKFGEAIGWKEDICFLAGKGGAQPLGIGAAPCKIQTLMAAGQDAGTFILENSTAMFARLRVRKEGSVAWLMNRTVFPQLPLFNVTAGTGGAPVFTNNVSGKPGQSLWGYPIIWTEKVPALGTAGCVRLVDFSDYTVADDQTGPEIAQSIHLKFDYGQTAFRITKFIDGQNESAAALTPMYGDTLSPVIEFKAALS